MATEGEPPSQPGIAAMLINQTSARKPAREAIAAGAEVRAADGEVPHWMAARIAAARWRRPLAGGLREITGRDETVGVLARHRGGQLRTGITGAADRLWSFTLYFGATGTGLLACSGVKRSRSPSTKDSSEP
ncbi:hypothetical protein AB0F57_33225 [Streptomyces tanashiensis]|uniref:hypothetical protein n=1 Tax=Streptomyces tanashiensis TaxID=67367 RepID=UPI0033FE0EA2